MLIEIKDWGTDKVIFGLDKEDNTRRDTVEEAVRQCISLCNANLYWADLHDADLRDADLSYAVLTQSNLSGADLRETNLYAANLYAANLKGANLSGANLHDVNLGIVDLTGVDLTGANIEGCDFDGTVLKDTIMPDFPMVCPEKGSFIAYKKLFYTKEYHFEREFIVKLEIPEDAKRSSATTNKCRCSKAKVLEIRDAESNEKISEITSIFRTLCTYKVGEMVYPDSFDECRWHECSNGIHFFMSEEEAINYNL